MRRSRAAGGSWHRSRSSCHAKSTTFSTTSAKPSSPAATLRSTSPSPTPILPACRRATPLAPPRRSANRGARWITARSSSAPSNSLTMPAVRPRRSCPATLSIRSRPTPISPTRALPCASTPAQAASPRAKRGSSSNTTPCASPARGPARASSTGRASTSTAATSSTRAPSAIRNSKPATAPAGPIPPPAPSTMPA